MSKRGLFIILLMSSILIALFSLQSLSAAVVSHYANQIRPGMFGQVHAGNWSFMNGSVGIGTSSPSYQLTVSGDSYLTGHLGVGTTPLSDRGIYAIGSTYGVVGSGAYGLYGSGSTYGVYGTGSNIAVYGYETDTGAWGVLGYNGYGIQGSSAYISGSLHAGSWAASSTAQNGYAKMANIYIQWGQYLSTQDGAQTFNFPTSFPNGCRVVVPSITLGGNAMAPSCTTSYFTIDRADTIDGNEYFYIIAIGY